MTKNKLTNDNENCHKHFLSHFWTLSWCWMRLQFETISSPTRLRLECNAMSNFFFYARSYVRDFSDSSSIMHLKFSGHKLCWVEQRSSENMKSNARIWENNWKQFAIISPSWTLVRHRQIVHERLNHAQNKSSEINWNRSISCHWDVFWDNFQNTDLISLSIKSFTQAQRTTATVEWVKMTVKFNMRTL